MDGIKHGALAWNPPVWRDVLRWPLPYRGFGDRLMLRAVTILTKGQVSAIRGLEYLPSGADPFILVANHSSKRDAVVMPALLMLHRGGRPIHFLADWNYQLIPGVSWIYRRAGAIVVPRKPARPRFLNVFKPYLVDPVSPIERARQHLVAGRPIGIFPEGRVNRNPNALLVGRHGAARLSLETGVPVVPMGLRFPEARGEALGIMEIDIGMSLSPPDIDTAKAPLAVVRDWHATLMSEIARLSGKAWRRRQGEPT